MVDAQAVLPVVTLSNVWSPFWLSLGALECHGGCFILKYFNLWSSEAPDFLLIFLGSLLR
jgi:hypothetical protein